jgi:hypothetical protein
MSSSKKFTCKETLRQVFICLRLRTAYPPYTLYTCIQVYLFTKGRVEGQESYTREKVTGARVQEAGSKIPT